MKRRKNKNLPSPSPLSRHRELAPRGTEVKSLDETIAPKLPRYFEFVESIIGELCSIADEMDHSPTKAVIKFRSADLVIRLMRLGKRSKAVVGPHGSQTEPLIDWQNLPPEVREKFSVAFEALERHGGFNQFSE